MRNVTIIALVGLAAAGSFVVVPRPVPPCMLPLPVVDGSRLAWTEENEQRRAEDARRNLLPPRTRIVGEQFRRLSAALAQNGATATQHAELKADVQRLLRDGHAQEILSLRALQADLFIGAVRAWEASAVISDELTELGGDFPALADSSFRRPEESLRLTDDQLRLLFRVRWGRLCGVHRQPPFGPDLEEIRRYYALQLELPERGFALDERTRALVQLETARALARVDPDYPGALAQGLLLLRAGESKAAALSIQTHLAAEPSGSWSLIAKNALLAALTEQPTW